MTWLILLIAFLLRLILLNQSLWLDESIEALALMGKMSPIFHYALYDFQPPLYHLILLGWTKLAGYSEVALRFPSLLSGLGVVWFTLKSGQLLGGRRVGWITGILAATNPLLIYYSQEGRTYEMTACFIAASFYYLLLLLKNEKRNKDIFLYFLFTTLALWTSYIAWVVIGFQGLYLLFKKRHDLFKYTLAASLTLLLWIPSLLRSLGIGLSTTVSSPEWGKVVGGISIKALALTWVKMNIGRVGFDNKYIYGLVVILILLLHVSILRRIKKLNPILLLWMIAPIVVASFISFFVPIYSYFRVLFIVPAYLLILSLGLSRSGKLLTTLVVVSQLLSLSYFWYQTRSHKEDWRALTQYLNSQLEGAVAMPSLNQSAPLTYYHLNKVLFEPKLGVVNKPNDIYYIRYVENLFDVDKKGPANLMQSGYKLVEEKSFTGLQLVKYEKATR